VKSSTSKEMNFAITSRMQKNSYSRQSGTAIVLYLVLISTVTVSAITGFTELKNTVTKRTAQEAAKVGYVPLK